MNAVKNMSLVILVLLFVACDKDDSEGDLGAHELSVKALAFDDFILGEDSLLLKDIEVEISEEGRDTYLFKKPTNDEGEVNFESLRSDRSYVLKANTTIEEASFKAESLVPAGTEKMDLIFSMDTVNTIGMHLLFVDSDGNGISTVNVYGYLSESLAQIDSTGGAASFSLSSNEFGKAIKYDLSKEIYQVKVLDTIAGINIDTISQVDLSDGGIGELELQVIE